MAGDSSWRGKRAISPNMCCPISLAEKLPVSNRFSRSPLNIRTGVNDESFSATFSRSRAAPVVISVSHIEVTITTPISGEIGRQIEREIEGERRERVETEKRLTDVLIYA